MWQHFLVTQSKRKGVYNMAEYHFHDHYEIYYLLSGERYFFIEESRYLLKKGSMLFIGKQTIHKSMDAGKDDHERINVFFTEPFLCEYFAHCSGLLLSPFLRENRIVHLNLQEQSFAESILFHMKAENDNASNLGRDISFVSHLAQLLLLAARAGKQPAEETANPMHPKVAEILEYCSVHFAEPISLEHLSGRFFISPYYLSRLFKKMTSFTLTEYVNLLRIREAQRLLRETDTSVIEIAQQVGYSNISHFNRNFKRIARMTPMGFKKNCSAAR